MVQICYVKASLLISWPEVFTMLTTMICAAKVKAKPCPLGSRWIGHLIMCCVWGACACAGAHARVCVRTCAYAQVCTIVFTILCNAAMKSLAPKSLIKRAVALHLVVWQCNPPSTGTAVPGCVPALATTMFSPLSLSVPSALLTFVRPFCTATWSTTRT